MQRERRGAAIKLKKSKKKKSIKKFVKEVDCCSNMRTLSLTLRKFCFLSDSFSNKIRLLEEKVLKIGILRSRVTVVG